MGTREGTGERATSTAIVWYKQYDLLFFSFISLIADGPHHYHPACGHKGSSHLSPVHALQFFYRDASSALLQLVNQWLKFSRYYPLDSVLYCLEFGYFWKLCMGMYSITVGFSPTLYC